MHDAENDVCNPEEQIPHTFVFRAGLFLYRSVQSPQN